MVAGLFLLSAMALSACKQAGGFGGAGGGLTTGTAGTASAPASLVPGGEPALLPQALAANAGFATLVDRQGISWSAQIGRPYDAASGRLCKPLRLTSLSRAGTFDRIACVDRKGIWTMVTPLRGEDGGPSF